MQPLKMIAIEFQERDFSTYFADDTRFGELAAFEAVFRAVSGILGLNLVLALACKVAPCYSPLKSLARAKSSEKQPQWPNLVPFW